MKIKLKKKQKLNLFRNLGNLLMLIPLIILLYIYYPLIFIYVDPPKIMPTPPKGVYIEIEKIHAQAPIVENVNPWDAHEYNNKLMHGVAHALGSSPIGSHRGTIYLFAHSSDVPWNITRQNSAFFRIGELRKTDRITLIKNGKKYIYAVSGNKTVWPNDVKYLKDLKKTQLILQTCTPIGTSLQRLLVFADPVIDKKVSKD
jgi:LPXTG-site transpeptidase (sortase) family protein